MMVWRRGDLPVQFNKTDNRGFSLVEVLVCVAILVIICVPLFSGFQYAAHNTKRAHSTQKITQYAQETMETVKSISVEELEAQIDAATDEDGNLTGSKSYAIDTVLQSAFPATTYSEELFKIRTYEQTAVRVGGELYDMKLVLDPTKYSSNAAGTTAADANVNEVTDIEEIDSMLFPVIADEINSYEGAAGSGVLYNLLSRVRENQLSGFGINEQARLQNIYANTVKTVTVTVKNEGSETIQNIDGVDYVNGSIKVNCDLKYETNYAGITLQEIYHVYTGTFVTRGIVRNAGTPEEYVEWEKGGRVFVFAKAYKDQNSAFAGLNLGANHMVIDNQYTGTGQMEIYLVRGCYGTNDLSTGIDDRRGMNFDSVTVNGSVYSTVPSMDVLTGEEPYGNTLFKTNIKGAIAALPLSASDIAQTVGIEKPKMRCYEVLLEFTDADGKKVVSLTSTKLMNEASNP